MDPHEKLIKTLEEADEQHRGTGRTTKMLYQALMSDAKYVTIFGPNQQVIRHIHKMFRVYAPHPDKITESVIRIADKQYRFQPLYSDCHQNLIGIMDLEIFFDHTVFEVNFIQSYTFKEAAILNEIQKRCDAWRASK